MSEKDWKRVKQAPLLRKWDILIFVVFVAVSVCFFLFIFQPQGEFAEIFVKGNLVYRSSLTQSFQGEFEGVHVIIENNSIRVSEANCPDRLCVKTGAVSKAGSRIICAPNAVVIKITGGDRDAVIG